MPSALAIGQKLALLQTVLKSNALLKTEDDGLIYAGGLELYPEGTNLILE